jgi:hypothetical protein
LKSRAPCQGDYKKVKPLPALKNLDPSPAKRIIEPLPNNTPHQSLTLQTSTIPTQNHQLPSRSEKTRPQNPTMQPTRHNNFFSLKSLAELSKKSTEPTCFNIVLTLKEITDRVLKHKASQANIPTTKNAKCQHE